MFKFFKSRKKEIQEAVAILNEGVERVISANNNNAAAIQHANRKLVELQAALQNISSKRPGDREIEIRQYCAQVAALCVQREGGDIIHLSRKIYQYVMDSPFEDLPDNIVPMRTTH